LFTQIEGEGGRRSRERTFFLNGREGKGGGAKRKARKRAPKNPSQKKGNYLMRVKGGRKGNVVLEDG